MARIIRLPKRLFWTATGAAVAYFCDPANGRSRRVRVKDQLSARVRDVRREAERKARYAENTAAGKAEAVRRADSARPEDDKTLVDKIKSEVLGSPRFSGHKIVVDAHDGAVTLRGEIPDAALANDLVGAVEKIAGVQSVESLVHAPGEPAPNKEPSLKASTG